MDNTVFFQKLLTDDIDQNDFFNYLESNSIDKYIILLSKISQKNNIENIAFHINLRNILISNISAFFNWRGKFTILEPIYNISGGTISDSDYQWPIIKYVYEKNGNILQFTGKEDKTININIEKGIKRFIDKGPLFGKGTYSSVYNVKMEGKIYILKLFKKNINHFLYDDKCIDNYKIYKDNLMKINLHGIIQFRKEENIKANNQNNTEKDIIKNFDFYYILTNKYNIITSQEDLKSLSNTQKYDLVMNLLKLLQKMYERNEFHTDLHIRNIGYNDNFEIILIDYDDKTIMSVSDAEMFKNLNPEYNFHERLSTSIKPNYIIDINDVSEYKKYNKYSTIAYRKIIEMLNIKLINDTSLHDSTLYDNSLVNSMNYDEIPTYKKFIKDLIEKRNDIIYNSLD
jgi:hypothetical protein